MSINRKKIGVNTRLLLTNKLEGIGRFTLETLKRIVVKHNSYDFYFFFDRDYDEQFILADNVKPIVLFPQARHPFLWYLWFEWAIPSAIKKYKIDYFISQDGFTSTRLNIPNLLVMHDLAFEHFPQNMGKITSLYLRHYSPLFAKNCNRLVTVSEFSKNDIVDRYNIDPAKIDVVYNGVNSSFQKITDPEKIKIKKEFTDSNDYFLFVSAIHPRKNLERLLQAFDKFKETANNNVKLVIVGRMAWQNEEVKATFENLKFKNDVILTGHLPITKVEKLYGAAIALCYISMFEGFGIPIIEAMNAYCPVITSNTSSMPEVAGEAALLIDPYNIDSISNAMHKMYNDDTLKENLIKKGLMQKEKFSWDKSADSFWESFIKII